TPPSPTALPSTTLFRSPGEVGARAGVAYQHFLAFDDQLPDILERDVAGDLGVVERTGGILLDDADLRHLPPRYPVMGLSRAPEHRAGQTGMQAVRVRLIPAFAFRAAQFH